MELSIIVAGDFAPKAMLSKKIEERRFSELFTGEIREVIKSADFSFVNFESPVVEDGYKPILKCGPNLRCTPEAAEAVRYAGFTGVTMANNHILDFGAEGLRRSVECCQEQGLDVVGVGENLHGAEKVLYLEKDGRKLAIINCCEHEFSIATESEAGANPLNPIRQYYAIQETKKQADYVLVIVHGGHEHFQLPSPRMQETYRFFIDAGADAVVNHHQHCYSGYEIYNGKPIFYGLGNFCFDWLGNNTKTWHEGYMVNLIFEDTNVSFELHPYTQCLHQPGVFFMHDKEKKDFEDCIKKINEVIKDNLKLNDQIKSFYQKTQFDYRASLEPYSGRVLTGLLWRNLLPSLLTRRRCLKLINYIECESHYERMLYYLKSKIFKQ